MAGVPEIADDAFQKKAFQQEVKPGDLLFFVLNVGDGDTQLIVLPEKDNSRRAIVVDVKNAKKLGALVEQLSSDGLLSKHPGRLPLVVATHPHSDHIAGMPSFLGGHSQDIGEFWDPGFISTTAAFHEMMAKVENHVIARRRPTSGYVGVIDNVRVTVLTPSVRLKTQFATRGMNPNNASLAMRVEFPASRVESSKGKYQLRDCSRTASLILGADAQLEAWAHGLVDFPRSDLSCASRQRAIAALVYPDVLRARVLKVPHHGSKRGISFEVAERVGAKLSIVSCANGGKHGFPHQLARGILREAHGAKPFVGSKTDSSLGIHYTGAETAKGPLGTICVQMNASGKRHVWRFQDGVGEKVDFGKAVRMK